MTRPANSPLWASTGTKTDPGAAKRLLGWLFKDTVAYDQLNWLLGNIGDWLTYLDDATSVQYGSLPLFISGAPVGRIGWVDDPDLEQWDRTWTKSPSQLGGVLVQAKHLASDGVRIFVAGVDTGTGFGTLKAFNVLTGVEEWTHSTGVAITSLVLRSDGRYLVWGYSVGGTDFVKSYELDDGTPLHAISTTNLVDIFSDGDQLYVLTTNATYIEAYSSYWDTGSIGLEWDDNTVRATLVAESKVTTDGRRVYVGYGSAGADNLLIYERDGTFFAIDRPQVAADTLGAVASIKATEDHLFIAAGSELLMYPAGSRLPLVGTYGSQGLAHISLLRSGNYSASGAFGGEMVGLTERYMMEIDTPNVRLSKVPNVQAGGVNASNNGGLAAVYVDAWDVPISDGVLTATHFAYGGQSNSEGKAVACYGLPRGAGGAFRRVDPAANYRRAPMWQSVKEVRS